MNNKLKYYILYTLSSVFLSIFMPLLTIASIIILVRISTVTAIVQLDANEMVMLYLYTLPQVLFFSIPVAFFVAGIMTIQKFSNENEMVVLFALGIKPGTILRVLLKAAIPLSLLLLFTSLVVVPHTTQLYENFISFKKSSATFNIKASEFGQSFGEWMLYIGKDDNQSNFQDVALFQSTKDQEIFVIADKAKIISENMQLKFKLAIGKSFTYQNDNSKITQINFDRMQINDTSVLRNTHYLLAYQYWKVNIRGNHAIRQLFMYSIMFSILPILSAIIFMIIGVKNNRHQQSFTYLYTFIAIAAYFTTMTLLFNVIDLYAIPVSIMVWVVSTYLLYKRIILKRY